MAKVTSSEQKFSFYPHELFNFLFHHYGSDVISLYGLTNNDGNSLRLLEKLFHLVPSFRFFCPVLAV